MGNILKIAIDIGIYSTKVSFLDKEGLSEKEVYVDFSGGYGEKSFLSWIFYSFDADEFIFGEYAKNEIQYSKGVLFDDLPKLIEENQNITLLNKTYSGTEIVSFYIENLLKYLKGINPSIDFFEVIFIYKYANENFKENILKVVSNIKSIKKTILLDNILSYFYKKDIRDNKYIIMDISHRDTWFYSVEKKGLEVYLYGAKNFEHFNFQDLDRAFGDMLTAAFVESVEDIEITDFEREKISQLARENKRKFITSFKKKKDVKVYYDFVTPPFAITVKKEYIAMLMEQEVRKIQGALEDYFKDNYSQKIISIGYGTAFTYVKDILESSFKDISLYKDDCFVSSALSYFISHEKLTLIKDYDEKISLDDLKDDYVFGFMGEEFIPLCSNSLNSHEVLLFINEYVEDEILIPIFKSYGGDVSLFQHINISYFKKRSKGTLKLNFKGEIVGDKLLIEVGDYGFGDIYIKTAYNEKFEMKI